MRRFTPRITVRHLFVLLLVVAAYFGAWEATKRAATRGQECPCPFVLREHVVPMAYSWEEPLEDYPSVAVTYLQVDASGNKTWIVSPPSYFVTRHWFWFFGARRILHEVTNAEPTAPLLYSAD